jgi:hypothetical protein
MAPQDICGIKRNTGLDMFMTTPEKILNINRNKYGAGHISDGSVR